MPIAAAIPAIIGVGGSVAGAAIQSRAAGNAANTQAAAAQQAGQIVQQAGNDAAQGVTDATQQGISGVQTATQSAINTAQQGSAAAMDANRTGVNQGNQTLADLINSITQNQSAYTGAGNAALSQIAEYLAPGGAGSRAVNMTPQEFQNTPGFQFELEQGMRALQRGAAASGKLLSGSALKEGMRFSQGLASTRYGEAQDRALRIREATLSPLMSLAGLGQTATQNVNAAQAGLGGQIAQNQVGAGRFDAESLTRLSELVGGLTTRGAETVADLGMRGASQAGQFRLGGAQGLADTVIGAGNARGAAQVAQGNAWGGAVASGGRAIGDYLTLRDIMNRLPAQQQRGTI